MTTNFRANSTAIGPTEPFNCREASSMIHPRVICLAKIMDTTQISPAVSPTESRPESAAYYYTNLSQFALPAASHNGVRHSVWDEEDEKRGVQDFVPNRAPFHAQILADLHSQRSRRFREYKTEYVESTLSSPSAYSIESASRSLCGTASAEPTITSGPMRTVWETKNGSCHATKVPITSVTTGATEARRNTSVRFNPTDIIIGEVPAVTRAIPSKKFRIFKRNKASSIGRTSGKETAYQMKQVESSSSSIFGWMSTRSLPLMTNAENRRPPSPSNSTRSIFSGWSIRSWRWRVKQRSKSVDLRPVEPDLSPLAMKNRSTTVRRSILRPLSGYDFMIDADDAVLVRSALIWADYDENELHA